MLDTTSVTDSDFFEFFELHLTGEMNKPVTFCCLTVFGLSEPKISKMGLFLTEFSRNDSGVFGHSV